MIAQYGNYRLPSNSVIPVFSGAAKVYSARQQALVIKRRIVIEGEVIPTDAQVSQLGGGSITDAIAVIKNQINNAFSLDGGDFFFVSDSGIVIYSLQNTGSLGGVQVVEGPTFTSQDFSGHLATSLPFSVAIEAKYPALTDGFVDYHERIERIGNGGPRYATVELDNGLPVQQIVSTNTPITVIQSGMAVGFLSQPPFNDPIYASGTGVVLENADEATSADAPQRMGDNYVNYVSRWNYRFTLTQNATVPLPLKR